MGVTSTEGMNGLEISGGGASSVNLQWEHILALLWIKILKHIEQKKEEWRTERREGQLADSWL
jgi:hypothetical protein